MLERLERGRKSIHKTLDNPMVRVLKVDADITSDGAGGHYEQNKYTLLRKDGTEERLTDGDLADKLHPMDILFLKKIYDEDKGNTKVIRRALNNISKAAIKLFQRIALSDFALFINYDYVHQKKVHIPPPDTSIPKELEKEARTGVILEQVGLSVVFRDIEGNKALFRTNDICKYSNQTLKYIKECMNKKHIQLQAKGKHKELLRKEIEEIIVEWINARGWYKEMYDVCHKFIHYKKKLKKDDLHKPAKLF
ncbi:hypothetical protein HanIR_Chr11g0559681 [Helianthus annuus]|nr:hypothetical protein HanIR_Chr11g0559681 [Helianthus annuus]